MKRTLAEIKEKHYKKS